MIILFSFIIFIIVFPPFDISSLLPSIKSQILQFMSPITIMCCSIFLAFFISDSILPYTYSSSSLVVLFSWGLYTMPILILVLLLVKLSQILSSFLLLLLSSTIRLCNTKVILSSTPLIIYSFSSLFIFTFIRVSCLNWSSIMLCCLHTPMTLASGGSPMFPLVVHQPASPSIWLAVQSLRRGLSTNPGATMWCVCGCS